MIDHLLRFSIARRWIVMFLMLAVAGFGAGYGAGGPQETGGEGGGAVVGDENVTSDPAAETATTAVSEEESCGGYVRTMYQIQNDTEKRSIITMLKTFKRLSSFGSVLRLGGANSLSPSAAAVQQKLSLDNEIAYWMRINHGGRILLESSPHAIPGMGGAVDCSSDDTTTTIDSSFKSRRIESGASRKIPLSLWPHVLERSMKGPTVCPGSNVPAMIDHNPREKDGGATACLYYLLRNGPAFLNAATSGSI